MYRKDIPEPWPHSFVVTTSKLSTHSICKYVCSLYNTDSVTLSYIAHHFVCFDLQGSGDLLCALETFYSKPSLSLLRRNLKVT